MSQFFSNKFRTAVIALIIANTIWGMGPPIFKWALVDIGPFSLAFFRFLGAAIIMFPFAVKDLKVEKRDLRKLFLMAFLGITINISFFFVGLENAPSINAGIISSAGPIFILIGSFLFLHEKIRKKILVGANIGLFGVLIIILSPFLKSGINVESGVPLLGNLLLVVAMLGSTASIIFGRELMEKYNPAKITFWNFTIGAITFLPFFFNEFSKVNYSIHFTDRAMFAIIWGIIMSSAIAYFFQIWALKYMKASQTGIFLYIDPLATVLVAMPLLGEIPGPLYIVGAILVFLGIYIAEGRVHWHPIHLLKNTG
jgi:drug/metabolite transporter (DMT)-like permease